MNVRQEGNKLQKTRSIMTEPDNILAGLLATLRLSFSHLQLIGCWKGMLVVQFGENKEAALAVTVNDPAVPTFDALYPRMAQGGDGRPLLEAGSSNRLLGEDLMRIADQINRHGAVNPDGV